MCNLFFTLSLTWLSIPSLTLKLVFKYRVLRHLFCRRISDSACILKVWHRRRTHWSLLMFVLNDFSLPFQNNSEGKKTGALSAAHVSKGCQPLVPGGDSPTQPIFYQVPPPRPPFHSSCCDSWKRQLWRSSVKLWDKFRRKNTVLPLWFTFPEICYSLG